MSKASEYAAKMDVPEVPKPIRHWNGHQLLGEVTQGGQLSGAFCLLSPTEALAFARWILDTFGDEMR